MPAFHYQLLRRIHLWLALPFAFFLIIQGLSGAVIMWKYELDAMLNPDLLRVVVPRSDMPGNRNRLPLSLLLTHLEQDKKYGEPSMLELPIHDDEVVIAWYRSGKSPTRQVMLNPYSGEVLGERISGQIGLSRALFIPTVLSLHRQLLSGNNGKLMVTFNGVVLAIMALSGIYLWWPVWRKKAVWQALTVSYQGSWKRFNYRLHRATGFYAAPVFLMFAITGVYFNQPEWISTVASPFVAVLVKNTHITTSAPITNANAAAVQLNLDQIIALAKQQFPLAYVSRISLPRGSDSDYEVRLHQPGELRKGSGATKVSIDADHGVVVNTRDPLKTQGEALFYSYFFPLHNGELFGTIGKIILSIVGLLPILFAVSGTRIWLRRR